MKAIAEPKINTDRQGAPAFLVYLFSCDAQLCDSGKHRANGNGEDTNGSDLKRSFGKQATGKNKIAVRWCGAACASR